MQRSGLWAVAGYEIELFNNKMKEIYVELWCQFAPAKDGKWTMRAWAERPDWRLPDSKYWLVRIPVPAELIGGKLVAEVTESNLTKNGEEK